MLKGQKRKKKKDECPFHGEFELQEEKIYEPKAINMMIEDI